MKRVYLLALFTLLTCLTSGENERGAAGRSSLSKAQTPYKAKPKSLQQWQDARYGMFIHWGPVSLTEKEISWSRANTNPKCPNNGATPADVYDNLYKEFNPVEFDAKEWVSIAQAAGMKYMVFTAKHCDGFLMWDSKVDDYNIMNTPFGRDVCAELADAAHEAGMKLGWYFSPMDWRDPDCRNEKNAEFVKRMQAELTELLSNYGKIDILWFDSDGRPVPWDQDATYSLVRKLQPDIIIDNRLDIATTEEWITQSIGPWADFHTPEQYIGGFDKRPWESCMTVSARNQWSWGGKSDGVKSFESCLNMVTGCAGGNGNVLMNVGPTPLGKIAPEQENRLKEVGSWLKKYGKSIYGSRGGPFMPGYYGVSTHKDKSIYLHLRNLGGGIIRLPAIDAKIKRAELLTGGSVSYTQSSDGIEITIAKKDYQPIDTIVELKLDRPASTLAPVNMALASLTYGKKTTASNTYQSLSEYAAGNATDGDDVTRWACDTGLKAAWLQVDLEKEEVFSRALIKEAYAGRIQKFQLQKKDGDKWITFYKGTADDLKKMITFDAVRSQHVRFNVSESTDGPTIHQFQLLK